MRTFKTLLGLFLAFFLATLPLSAEPAPGKVLLVVTSASQLASGHPTGLWLEEFAVPYGLFRAAGLEVTVASPEGGPAPLDARSLEAMKPAWEEARTRLQSTVRLDTLDADDFQGVFLAGGHGTVVDFATSQDLADLLRDFFQASKPVAAVCHGPAGLLNVRNLQGEPLIRGYRVTGFSNSEEKAVGLDQQVPFLLQDRLRELGALYECGPDFGPYVVRHRLLVTGQNPASSEATARTFLRLLEEAKGR